MTNPYMSTKLTASCSVASGSIPANVTLPLLYQGNRDLCQGFQAAKFCSIRTDVGKQLVFPNKVPIGPFRLDLCVQAGCPLDSLVEMTQPQIASLLEQYFAQVGLPINNQTKMFIGGQVASLRSYCDSPGTEEFPEKVSSTLDAWGVVVVVLFGLLLVAVVLATVLNSDLIQFNRAKPFITWFAANRNVGRLVEPMGGDFRIFNGMRVLSIAWIVLGHESRFAYMQNPLMNPTGFDSETRSTDFSIVAGAMFGVDTFLFLSGFLGAWGCIRIFGKGNFGWLNYLKVIVVRWLRLTPAYFGTLLFTWKVLPAMGSGITWYTYWNPHNLACEKHWWMHLLYVNNFIEGEQCFAHSWFLAVDFQCFLLLPFLVFIYFKGIERESKVLKYGPAIGLVIIQIMAICVTIYVNRDLPSFMEIEPKVYYMVWNRWTPYVIGALLALVHYERVINNKGGEWRVLSISTWKVATLLLASVAMLIVFILQFYWTNSCVRYNTCFVLGDAGLFYKDTYHNATIVLFPLYFLILSVILAVFSYILILDKRYDIFGIGTFLANRWFTPLARLTYCVYLLHYFVLFSKIAKEEYVSTYETLNAITFFFGLLTVSFILALFWYLLLEKPFMNMSASLFGTSRKPCVEQKSTLGRGKTISATSSTVAEDRDQVSPGDPVTQV
eukprot:CAMPEP_0203755374 /NCGR_PEP_ID=MMETSP0098-20131031/8823_1 /ASSEMBLY_ACC=CAM_ASM_000208 /TAXON_ID=96639 /ORGANISM=" , Strain NY0313808BC1" /LENGTH=665 /DNA_ID=CAMNT_0050646803 /DNA_START=423 /DNA_END=2420 /DNA_ORIENTATION=-